MPNKALSHHLTYAEAKLIWGNLFKLKCLNPSFGKLLAVNCVEKLLSLPRKHGKITAVTSWYKIWSK